MPTHNSLLTPTLRVGNVTDIHLETLRRLGVRGLIFDLDDTLVAAMEPHAHPEILSWITSIREEFQIYIVSNNPRRARVELAALHLEMPFHHAAKKPSRRYFRRALSSMNLVPEQVAIIGDQLFTDVLGGNRLGAVTILVDPLSKERRWYRKLMRRVEQYLLSRGRVTYSLPEVVNDSSSGVQ